ncbi:hypothetical protein Z043_100568 [Scleropages formosus]|uniref:Doublecortin domain-containing protein n=1 Tax=Scleropages formosus TaxID=113540 RepID=A0A0P7V0R2_SCLFO|nr:hypothetical protein Z043_100568 [Scleropages formosus]
MSGASGRASLPRIPPTKTIVMYRNGDAFFPPRKVVVNQRHVATFDRFLSAATRAVQAPFGAVRNVYTPLQGHRVVDLERLRHGEGYVAAGAERFKHLDVFTNGDVLVPPARILIPKYTLKNWESVLALVTQKVHLRTGAVHRLCTLDGTPLLGSIELENYQYYVAVGAERFRFLPYYQCIPSKRAVRAKDGNIFMAKSRRKEMMGAMEVQEDGRMKVDLPIDQMEAKVVDEEQYELIHSRSRMGSLRGPGTSSSETVSWAMNTGLGMVGQSAAAVHLGNVVPPT